MMWLGTHDVKFAKGAGFISGSLFSYFANRLWTFGYRSHLAGSALRFVMLYFLTLLVNIYVNELMLSFLSDFAYPVASAFLVATVLSATINFFGMHHFVFINANVNDTT